MGAHGLGWAAQLLLLMGVGGLGIFESWRSWAGLGRAGTASEGHGLGGHGQPFLMGHNALTQTQLHILTQNRVKEWS
jgi:hypothetical protein